MPIGGFLSGLTQGLGRTIQQHNEQNLMYQHQANEEQAQQYDRMAAQAEAAGNDQLAADLHKGSFAIRTTMPGAKPKKVAIADGSQWDPLDMQGLIQAHTRLRTQSQQNQPQQPQPVAPNGITPTMSGAGASSDDPGAPGQTFSAPSAMTKPPGMFQGPAQPRQQQPQSGQDPFRGYWQ